MTIKIIGPDYSIAVRRATIALAEKGQTWEEAPVDLFKGAHTTPEHLKIQPFGQVPVLEDSDHPGFTMFEARAIARYVENKFKGQGVALFGSSPTESALVDTWLSVEQSNFDPPASTIAHEAILKAAFGGGGPDADIVAKARVSFAKVLDVYEQRLSVVPYLAGEHFTFADAVHLPSLALLEQAGAKDLIDARPHVKAWFDKITSRPTWVKINA
ncbi:glutathione S-transferase, partial [Blyttiomyces helicus]